MRILDRYLGRAVIQGSLLALLVLLALAGFFAFLGELADLRNDYGVAQAGVFVLLSLPRQAYELFPTAVLVGSLMSLGNLAANSELVVVRAAGVSIARVVRSVLQAGLLLVMVAAVLGEVVAPPAERQARVLRSTAQLGRIALQSENGFWARDGSRFVNIRRVLPGPRFEDVYIYEYDQEQRLRSSTHAASAHYRDGGWLLEDVRRSVLGDERVAVQLRSTTEWRSVLDPELVTVLTVDPEDLSARSLARYIGYLKRNSLESAPHRLAFWVKVIAPLSTLVMLLIAIPFVFGPLRSTGSGPRLLVGILIGLVFYLLNQALNHVGLVYGLPPLISALLPSALFVVGGTLAIRRVA